MAHSWNSTRTIPALQAAFYQPIERWVGLFAGEIVARLRSWGNGRV